MTKLAGVLLGGVLFAGVPAWAQQGSQPDAQQIEKQIESSFQKDPLLKNSHLSVQVHDDGAATLWGNVDSQSERLWAEKLARANGATKVTDNIRVRAPASPTSPD